jgi:hypothetical protein
LLLSSSGAFRCRKNYYLYTPFSPIDLGCIGQRPQLSKMTISLQARFSRLVRQTYILFPLLALSGCLKDNEPNYSRRIDSVTPSVVQIGDTVTIEGSGLVCESCYVSINGDRNYSVISATENKIIAVVPQFSRENVYIELYDWNARIDSDTIRLNGLFHLLGMDVYALQSLDEDTFLASDNIRLLRTDDGGVNWSMLTMADLKTFFFLSREMGWIITYERDIHKSVIRYTEDSGQSFHPLDTIPFEISEAVAKMVFTSPNEGYLVSSWGTIYHTTDNVSFEEAYRLPVGAVPTRLFEALSAHGSNMMATGGNILITRRNNVFDYKAFDEDLGKIQLVSENEAFLLRGNHLFFSTDVGASWSQRSDADIYDFTFFDNNNGVAIVRQTDSHQAILFTHNGGIDWEPGIGSPSISYGFCMAFSGHIGFLTQNGSGNQSGLWKYVGQ